MVLTDTHTHLYTDAFDEDRDEVMARAREAGVTRFFLPAIDSSFQPAMQQMKVKYPGSVFLMTGLHPTHVGENYTEELERVEASLDKGGFVAVGEIGIDLYWDTSRLKEQTHAFRSQIRMAIAVDANQGWRVALVDDAPQWDLQRAARFAALRQGIPVEAGGGRGRRPRRIDQDRRDRSGERRRAVYCRQHRDRVDRIHRQRERQQQRRARRRAAALGLWLAADRADGRGTNARALWNRMGPRGVLCPDKYSG